MDSFYLVLGGFLVGMVGVLFGGSMFLALPLFQTLYPNFLYGQILGNLKMGSFARSLASTFSTWREINIKKSLAIAIPFVLASIAGVFLIAELAQDYLIYAIILAIFLAELSPKIAKYVNNKTRIIVSVILGLYTGFMGAGIAILLVAVLRTIYPQDKEIVFVKIQARFIEFLGVIFTVMTHIYHGNLIWPIWGFWALGSFAGGYFGGYVLKSSTTFSPKKQKIYLYLVYLVTLLPFGLKWVG